jgi:hypothetical protein
MDLTEILNTTPADDVLNTSPVDDGLYHKCIRKGADLWRAFFMTDQDTGFLYTPQQASAHSAWNYCTSSAGGTQQHEY